MNSGWTRVFLIWTAGSFAFYALGKEIVGVDGTPALGILITVWMLSLIVSAIPRRPKTKRRDEDAV